MVSKFGHCLNDLLYRTRSGLLDIEIVAVVSNHPDLRPLTQSYGIDYHHLPVTAETKAQAGGASCWRWSSTTRSTWWCWPATCRCCRTTCAPSCAGRVINIHHSFLPSFKGAKPYHQAHDRGVKLIGATAHYVTADLDEGPIIEQEVARVNHSHSPRTWSPSAATSSAWRWPAPSAGTPNSASCSTATRRSSSLASCRIPGA